MRPIWIVELPNDEGEALMELLNDHLGPDGRGHFDHECAVCRARSRVALGRDYPVPRAVTPKALALIVEEIGS